MQERHIIFNSGAEGRVNERNSIPFKLPVRVRESILWNSKFIRTADFVDTLAWSSCTRVTTIAGSLYLIWHISGSTARDKKQRRLNLVLVMQLLLIMWLLNPQLLPQNQSPILMHKKKHSILIHKAVTIAAKNSKELKRRKKKQKVVMVTGSSTGTSLISILEKGKLLNSERGKEDEVEVDKEGLKLGEEHELASRLICMAMSLLERAGDTLVTA